MLYKTTPRDYQKDVVETFINNSMDFAALHADMGLGKSKMIIDIAANLYARKQIDFCLVIAPNGAHSQFANEQIPLHCPVSYKSFVYTAQSWKTQKVQREFDQWANWSDGVKFLSVNVDIFSTPSGVDKMRDMWGRTGFDNVLIVVDEAHLIANPKANRTKTILKLGKAGKYKITSTGTPVTQSPFSLWSQFEFMKKDFWGINYFVFTKRYGLIAKRNLGGRYVNMPLQPKDFEYVLEKHSQGIAPDAIAHMSGLDEYSVRWIIDNPTNRRPYKNLDKLREIIKPHTFTILKKDHAKDLPEKIFSPLYIDLSNEQKRIYKDLIKNYYTEHVGEILTLDSALTLSLRLQQVTGGFIPLDDTDTPKPLKDNPKLTRLIDDLAETDLNKIIIVAQFRAEVDAIIDAIKKHYPDATIGRYDGSVSSKDKELAKFGFTDGDTDILVGNTVSLSTGLNLQVSSLMYIYSIGFSLVTWLQLQDRIHRMNTTVPPVYRALIASNSVDQKIYSAFTEKKEVADFFAGELDSLFQ